ncbi:acetyl-CoA carboxylase carboxyltransferase subunit beta [Romboutsia weinsteinii]|uniref:Acetyl-coenzyme A carboxylase carboxyl transferase subunit beta n=1 Tax=Romboutsia weinsteinii TaxID=2020949 RepID=A0A371J6N8_9FIRM|nr:acetyl-CoA carboxylase, carboxyltransferase subunit beta [Romboutsia weinsteinii]RDY28337.1 acetyl-CoA carboxylase carboxyltransferase subunit beta [Romboutsia weinsteinii]
MIKKFLSSKKKYITVSFDNKKENSVNDKFWIYCKGCEERIFKKEIEDNLSVCPKCSTHYKLEARSRISLLIDRGSFVEFNSYVDTQDPLTFPNYIDKLDVAKNKSKECDAVITGYGRMYGIKTVICVMNPDFMMGSMGSIVGDKITYAIEYAADNNLPIIICSASGGARMQEGMVSLIQMAKTSQALAKLEKKSLPYISLLTDPTTGGVTASFAMLGDIILAEPNALIGFAGPRVIEQTINQKLPDGFQSSEYLLETGFIDKIVSRSHLKSSIHEILSMHNLNHNSNIAIRKKEVNNA